MEASNLGAPPAAATQNPAGDSVVAGVADPGPRSGRPHPCNPIPGLSEPGYTDPRQKSVAFARTDFEAHGMQGRLGRLFRKGLGVLVFVAMAAASVRAAEADAVVEIEIPMFSGGYGTAFFEESARLFEQERPGVRIRLYGDPRIEDKLRVRAIDGGYPDAAFAPRLLWPALIKAGRVRDLRADLAGPNWEGDAPWGETFLPGSLESWRVGEGVYGVPFGYAAWTIFYNRVLFREHGWTEPRTWDEFFALCERIQATGLAPVSLTGVYPNYPDAFIRAAFYNLAGATGWRDLNALAPGMRADPRYVRAAGILQRITQNYTLRGWEGATHTAAQLAFLQGRAAIVVSGSWMLGEMAGKFPPGFELGSMGFPVFPEGAADPRAIQTGADSFFIFATGHPERERATLDFFRFLTSRARAEAFVRRQDSPVAVRGVPLEAYSELMRPTAELILRAPESFNMPQVALQPPAIRQALVDARNALMTGRLTPEEFGARVEAAADSDRARAAEPDKVDVRHPVAGTGLLTGLGIVAGAALVVAVRRRRTLAAGGTDGDGAAFGPLRPSVAAMFVGPALLLYGALVLLPGLASFGGAFLHWDGLSRASWAGLFNFKWLLFESDGFWLALRNNVYLMAVPALVVVPVALLFATMIHRGVWGASVFRVVLLFPNLLGGIAATLLWLNAYEPHGGLVNAALTGLGDFLARTPAPESLVAWLRGFAGYPWLAPANLYSALIPIYLWMACGFNLILYLAAMEGIDPQLYEAAELEGAPPWRQFFSITLPLIWDVVVVSAVFLLIAGLNAFEMIWLLTSQDPAGDTHTLGTLMVSSMFKDFQVGRATAIAVVLFALVLAGSAVVMRVLKREAIER